MLGRPTMDGGRLVRKGRGVVRRAAGAVGRLHPGALYRAYELRRWRERSERVLAGFTKAGASDAGGRVLVDAMWDNPNYWIRYALFRAAVGCGGRHDVGVLGPYRASEGRRTLARLGITEAVQLLDLRGDQQAHRREARRLLAQTRTPVDILGWHLPHDLPADFVYDGILKRQRSAAVDLGDPRLEEYVAEALGSIAAAQTLLASDRFELLLMSHAVNFQFAALAWIAVSRGIPVVLLYGNYGVPRFAKLLDAADMYDTTDRPKAADLAALPAAKAQTLAAVGQAYLDRRRRGHTDDIGARYAFQRASARVTRSALLETFGWDPDHPMVGVYAPNWFDFPHPCGMTQFRDFLDWIEATLSVAARQRRVNWLFKAHPCDQWYGGVTLSDLMPPLDGHRHMRLVPTDWNGSALLDAVDGVVTYHGTVGVEAASAGKPVLVADRGWYHDAGFVKWPRSREEYLDALATDWWKDLDLDATARLARIFSGWYFGRPVWQDNFVLDDDTLQAPIYRRVPDRFAASPDAVAREVRTIGEWFASDSRHYHTFKMGRTDEFTG